MLPKKLDLRVEWVIWNVLFLLVPIGINVYKGVGYTAFWISLLSYGYGLVVISCYSHFLHIRASKAETSNYWIFGLAVFCLIILIIAYILSQPSTQNCLDVVLFVTYCIFVVASTVFLAYYLNSPLLDRQQQDEESKKIMDANQQTEDEARKDTMNIVRDELK